MPKIIFVSNLTIWSMGKGHGGPAFSQTIQKYVDEKWSVYLISDEVSNQNYPFLDKANNVFIKPSIFKKYIGTKKIGIIFKWLDHNITNFKFKKAIKEVIRDDSKNIILYAYEIFGVNACKKISRKYKIPLVTRFQGTILSQYSNTLLNHIRHYPHYQALTENADIVIMTDDGTKGQEVLMELKNNSKTLFLRNGLELMEEKKRSALKEFDKEKFRKSICDIENEECMFLTVSRLVGWKKVERAICGFAKYYRHVQKGKLVIVGDGDAKESLIQLAKNLGIGENVFFVGSVPHDEVYNFMLASDVFLSLYDLSNVGNPLLEAMTLGKCIITLDVGDTGTLIENRENGILLQIEELELLGDVMCELSEQPNLRNQLGNAAALFATKHFYTWKERMDIEFKEVCSLLK